MKEGELGKVYSDGEIIFREGEEGDRMFVIQSGRVKVTKETPAGEIVIAILGNGEIFGEMALFSKSPRSATVTALGDARILGIDKKKLFSTISRDPTLVFKILESMSQRLRTIDEEFAKFKKSKLDRVQRRVSNTRNYEILRSTQNDKSKFKDLFQQADKSDPHDNTEDRKSGSL